LSGQADGACYAKISFIVCSSRPRLAKEVFGLNPVITIQQLEKSYGSFKALNAFDLSVPRGSIFGFLGPNGAGKSTTIRILLGLLCRDAGTATVLGMDAWQDSTAINARTGYLPGDVQFQGGLTGAAFLRLCARIRGGDLDSEIERLTNVFRLDLKKRIRAYSRGMKQKLGIIQALMHRPEVLILDEPTTGLDPLMQQALYDELRRVAADGRTVLFSSHTLSEVDLLCERVCVIRAGVAVQAGTIVDLRAQAPRRVALSLTNGAEVPEPARGTFQRGESHDGRIVGTWVGQTADLLGWLQTVKPNDVEIGPPTLEELFHQLYETQPNGGSSNTKVEA